MYRIRYDWIIDCKEELSILKWVLFTLVTVRIKLEVIILKVFLWLGLFNEFNMRILRAFV